MARSRSDGSRSDGRSSPILIARPIRSTVCSNAFAVRIGVKIASVSADEPPFARMPILRRRLAGVCDPAFRRSAIIPA